jgi:hypothetical protein
MREAVLRASVARVVYASPRHFWVSFRLDNVPGKYRRIGRGAHCGFEAVSWPP